MKVIGKILKGVGAVVVLLVVLGLIFGGSSSDDKKDYSSDQGVVSVSEEEAAEDEGAAEQQAEQKQTEQKQTEQKQTEQKQADSPKEKYTITEEALDNSDPYVLYITGKLTNNTSKDLSYLQVEYNLYDAEGDQVGTAIDNINNLKAGGSWKFKAVCLENVDSIASFELADVSGW